ncbi:MAG: hypothetical protein AABX72_02840, partial [Nanoarchaeota archaeon]
RRSGAVIFFSTRVVDLLTTFCTLFLITRALDFLGVAFLTVLLTTLFVRLTAALARVLARFFFAIDTHQEEYH